jgi:ribosomal protein L37E
LESCTDCGRDNLEQYHNYCRRCGAKNPSYVEPDWKIAEPTKTEINLARMLFVEGIDFTLSPEIWFSSCTLYTPDFLIEGRLVVEIDGPYHYANRHQVLKDRIRERAIQNSGYFVHRFTNREVNKSLENTVNKIVSLLRTLKVTAKQARILQVDVQKEHRLSNMGGDILKEYAPELNKRILADGWTASLFKDFFSGLDPDPSTNRCAMQTMMLILLGLNFHASKDGTADFKNYVVLFGRATNILREFFGEIATVELRNEFNITATNFLKNLVFYGRPRILPHRVVNIKNYDDVQGLVKSFNSNFSTFGIAVVEDDLKIECQDEKKKIAEKLRMTKLDAIVMQGQTNPEKISKFDWIDRWGKE